MQVADTNLFINGEFVPAADGATIDVTEPATGQPLATVAIAGKADIDAAVDAARAALAGPWGRLTPGRRSSLLHALAQSIDDHRDMLVELESRNVGKARGSVAAEVAGSAEQLRYFASATTSIEGRSNPIGGSMVSYTLSEPVGVCAQIVPWNYPLSMAMMKIAPALAAGCTLVLKPDPITPLTALVLARLATEVGIPPGVLNVVPADGPSTGSYLVGHRGVDKVAFTGSTASGTSVMSTAAQTIKRVSLELGGKSPSIVFADADLESAVPAAVWSVFTCAGQSCEARSRVLVERPIFDEFVQRFVERTERLNVGDPADPATEIGSLISTTHRERVHGLVKQAIAEGGDLRAGGVVPDGPGAFYPPTVFVDPENALSLERFEIFGPVATIVPFEDEADAIRIANDSDYGLMATIWTTDPARGPRVAGRLEAGTVGVNMPYTSFPGVPFGGYKQSGFGRELALDTLQDYLETKSVILWAGRRSSSPLEP